ncbi:MAG: hypothetical protein LBJ10_08285 [Clostridiales bacterium]|jgi:hypothetical protein|nr:hypothetical protein [Clostridiales bacterium]
MAYSIYFEGGGAAVYLPVNPEEYTISYGTDHTSTRVLGLGEIVIPRERSPARISWAGLLPGSPDDPALQSAEFLQPFTFIYAVLGLMRRKETFTLVFQRRTDAGRRIFDTRVRAVVSSFSYAERGGETGDFYYDIELTEYRNYSPRALTLASGQAGEAAAGQIAVASPARAIGAERIAVGDKVALSGRTWSEPDGGREWPARADGLIAEVFRIDDGKPYPYALQQCPPEGVILEIYGWAAREQLAKRP